MGIFNKLFGKGAGDDTPAGSSGSSGSSGSGGGNAGGAKGSPEFDMLMREAKRLERTGQVLSEDGGGEPTAYWHGKEEGALCISLRYAGAWLNVYLDDEEGGRAEALDQPTISDEPLFAEPRAFLPHIDTVFERGSDAVEAFLEANDWTREDPYNDNFPHPAAAAYNNAWMDSCPLYQGDAYDAAVGGWQMPWPDDDWDEVKDLELVVWTLRDSEPWVEVFKDTSGGFIVKQRIT